MPDANDFTDDPRFVCDGERKRHEAAVDYMERILHYTWDGTKWVRPQGACN